MPKLAQSDFSAIRCRNHADREAVARCVQCKCNICRECVVEHEGQMLCNACLQAAMEKPERQSKGRLRGLFLTIVASSVFIFMWVMLMQLGRILLSVSDKFQSLNTQ